VYPFHSVFEAHQASVSENPTAAKKDVYTLMVRASDVVVEAVGVVDEEEEMVDSEYEAETLPLSPEAGQRVENLERQSAAPQSLEDSAS
jgi:hypothetical protein